MIRRSLLRHGRYFVAPIGLILLACAWATTAPEFMSWTNASNVGAQASALAIVALGEMVVLVSGGFDISVGSVVALSTVVAALTVNAIGPIGILAAPLVGLAAGAVNGFLVGQLAIAPIIATLGMLSLARGFALIVSADSPVVLKDSGFLTPLAYGSLGPIPLGFGLALAVLVGVFIFVSRTRLGRRIAMLGSNSAGARLVGVNVESSVAWAYALSGLSAGIAGVLFLARGGVGLPTVASGFELQAIAAAVIGGTSLAGGLGTAVPVFVGALFIQLLSNGLDLLGLSPFVKEVVLGGVIIVAGLLDFVISHAGSLATNRTKEDFI